MITTKWRYVHEDIDRHGNVRTYFKRPGGPKIRMREGQGTEAFARRYYDLLKSSDAGTLKPEARGPVRGTWEWLAEEYMRVRTSPFRKLDATTQRTRRGIIESTFAEPIAPGRPETFADIPIDRMGVKQIKVLRDRKQDLPEAANHRLSAIRAVLNWALEQDPPLVRANHAAQVKGFKRQTTGYHTWTPEELEQYEGYWPIGTKARLAISLLSYTGVRRSDVVRLGKQHIRGGRLKFTAFKNRNRSPVTIDIPVLPESQAVLDASPLGDLTFLVNDLGQPFTAAGFGNKMRDWCDKARLPECSAHGVRKAAACLLAENGRSENELMAIFGWKTSKEAQVYVKEANRKRMAERAIGALVRSKA
jgi:integrase